MSGKKISDLTKYIGVLPYASELLGVYQPLLGWKSKRKGKRHARLLEREKSITLNEALKQVQGSYKFLQQEGNPAAFLANRPAQSTIKNLIEINVGSVQNPVVSPNQSSFLLSALSSAFADRLANVDARDLENKFIDACDQLIHADALKETLNSQDEHGVLSNVINAASQSFEGEQNISDEMKLQGFSSMLEHESKVAGMLLYLKEKKQFDTLKSLFLKNNSGPFENLNFHSLGELFFDRTQASIKEKAEAISLSPIGLVHLFRQYFFELDTFLGTPIEHIWLSPAASAELIEVSSKRILTERSTEFSTETLFKSELEKKSDEEMSDLVRENNRQDIKFGASVTASYMSVTASSNFDYAQSQEEARESTHKRTRQQSEKISQELKQTYKTTFKTVIESNDTHSKRYILANNTAQLINYEMRRKMRQIAIQVQDIGTYLCWETFVDEPGKQLGLANLVHIASDESLSKIHDPEKIILPESIDVPSEISYPWRITELPNGVHILKLIPVIPPRQDYILSQWTLDLLNGPPWDFKIIERAAIVVDGEKRITELAFVLDIHNGDDDGIEDDRSYDFKFKCSIRYVPSKAAIQKNKEDNDALINKTTEERSLAAKEDFIKKVRERIKLASEIRPRKNEDLREEERIIIYRNLIKSLMHEDNYQRGESTEELAVRHNLSEYLNSLFDIDKMLYFVAPEWWKPSAHHGQFVGTAPLNREGTATTATNNTGQAAWRAHFASPLSIIQPVKRNNETQINSAYLANWSSNEQRSDNYLITEESAPAPLGASLGWLMQLDGDNMRNAFLNAPWVKAVMPIRPGKEKEALAWLRSANVEGIDGLDAMTETLDENNVPMSIEQSINQLIDKLNKKHEYQKANQAFGKKELADELDEAGNPVVIDDRDKVLSRPINKVFEHGFYPLQNSFAFKPGAEEDTPYFDVFDQWIEIVPTDQIVPVAVEYDPKTGRMK